MRKIIGIGETILDIIFKEDKPLSALPGGSVFNGIVSLSKLGMKVCFISEVGNDRVGEMIKHFMQRNDIATDYINTFPNGKSPVSLAFLNENNDADYQFYKDYPNQRLEVKFPVIEEDDILIFGSYYALNPVLRNKVTDLLEYARQQKAIIYYDLNFRSSHMHEAIKLNSAVIENLEYANIVRGSREDFANLYNGLTDADKIYKGKIQFYCPNMLYTAGNELIRLRTSELSKEYPAPAVTAVSTVGAGDNFNAGILFGLIKENIRYEDINQISEEKWDRIIQYAKEFSGEVCKTYENSISETFAKEYRL